MSVGFKYGIVFLMLAVACVPVFASGPQDVVSSVEKEAQNVLARGFSSTDLLVKTCFILMAVFFVAIITTVVMLFSSRVHNAEMKKRTEDLRNRYELLLTGIIFNDEEEMDSAEWKEKKAKLVQHFKKNYLGKAFNRMVLCEQILLLHRNFSGSSATVLRNLYLELKLDKEALRRLRSPDWSEKGKAVKELTQMEIKEAGKKIRKLIRHENPVLRLEAKNAVLLLDDVDPFAFLDDKKTKLLEWQQVNLAQTMRKMDRSKIPDFSRWLTSPNTATVKFSIRMMVLYNQFEGAHKLIQLLSHKNEDVLSDVVRAIGELNVVEAEAGLFGLYDRVTDRVKKEILLVLGKLGSAGSIVFLKEKLQDSSFDLSFSAASGLKYTGFEGEAILEGALTSGNGQVVKIARHLLDERI